MGVACDTRARPQVNGILNKLTLEKFDKLTGRLKEIKFQSLRMVSDFIDRLFQKAMDEQSFGEMYADLCKVMDAHCQQTPW